MAPPKPGSWTGLLDLSENNSTLGVPPVVMASMRNASATGGPSFIAAASARGGVPVDHILPGNGTLELIHAACRALLAHADRGGGRKDDFVIHGDHVAVMGPTFGEFRLAAEKAGAAVTEVPAAAENGFRWDIPEAARTIRSLRPAMVFVCNPNNPTGTYLSMGEAGELVAAAGAGTVILDEAYAGLVAARWPVPREWLDTGRLLVLRSVSKACALEFLGAGYAVGAPALIRRIAEARGDMEMNPVTAAGAAAYLADPGLERAAGEVLRASLVELAAALAAAGFRVLPAAANFTMVETGGARRFRWEMMRRGVLAKELDGYGLPGWIRIAAPPPGTVPVVARAFVAAREALS